MSTASPSRRLPVGLLIASGIVLIILLALGTWQVERLQWKEALIASSEQRLHDAPLPLEAMEAIYAKEGTVDYRPVTVTGTFKHAGERHFLATHAGAAGYNVYTPLLLEDGRTVLVNRGFVSYDKKDATRRMEGQIAGTVTITGLARDRLSEKPSWLIPDNDPSGNIFYWKDWAAMVNSSGIADDTKAVPFFIDANDALNPGGLPIGGVTIIDFPNNHLQYALTWYGLAAALAGVVGVWLWRYHKAAGDNAGG